MKTKHVKKPKSYENWKLFKKRFYHILTQLSSDQQEELFDILDNEGPLPPKGYPFDYNSKTFDELTEDEIKFLHDKFIDIQYSEDPTLQGEDIRGVAIYPYKT